MERLKKYSGIACWIVFLSLIFVLSIVPLRDFDIWFHIKSGEVILQKGIIHYDVFSYNTAGREWFPYEWLFQITVAILKQWFGFESIKYVIAAVVTILMGTYLAILKNIFRVPLLISCAISFLFYASTYEFATARPHILAYTFFLLNLFFILLYIVRNKNWLWMTLPITLLWANMHGSIFLDVGIFGCYTVLAWFRWRNKFRTLGIYTALTGVLTILPPLGFLQYRLLWIFSQKNYIMSRFIDEWTPLSANPYGFTIYTISLIAIGLMFVITLYRKKTITPILIVLPILIFLIIPYTAARNLFLGYITLGILAGYALKHLITEERSFWINICVGCITLLAIIYHIGILAGKRVPLKLYYPVKVMQFLKTHHVAGHMFNEYGYGGYILYQLYPDYQVFYDGRTDLYIDREMPDTLDLATRKNDSDLQFKKIMDSLWQKYDISFVILRTQKHTVLRKMQRILTADPAWALVFWDDYSQLFVRRDGKNDDIVNTFTAQYATPYDKNPVRENAFDRALPEYIRMGSIADSGHTRNAIGYIYLKQGKFEEAKKEFEQAILLDPSFESPLMNLAELYAKERDLDRALVLYQRALNLAPDRGLIYIRLGQLLMAQTGDRERVRKIWQDGVEQTVDTDAKAQLQKLLEM